MKITTPTTQFLSASGQATDKPLNMSGNIPPKVPRVINDLLSTFPLSRSDSISLGDLVGAHQFLGSERDRIAGAAFVKKRLANRPSSDRIVVANGTQSLLTMLLAGLVGRGGSLAIDALSYPTIRQFAEMLGFRTSAVQMDNEGADPDSFEAVCKKDAPSAYYALPTLQNPTTSTMSEDRRRTIAGICRRYGVAIIEDDIYSLLPQNAPLPLSAYAPELSWYILGTAKSMAPAFKIAYLVAPTARKAEERFWPGVRATYWMCAPLGAAVMSHLIETGGAETLIEAVRCETKARQALVTERLAGADLRTRPDCLHVWLSLPDRCPRADFAAKVLARGVQISTSDTYAFGVTEPPNAIRFGMGTPCDRETFERGIGVIAHTYFENVENNGFNQER